MPPEQWASTHSANFLSDIWALGVIAYELIAGRVPFDGGTMPVLYTQVITQPPTPLLELRPDAPPGLQEVIFKCLEKDPKDRYPSVAEFAVALSPFAPRRSREIIRRITDTLRVAGMATEAAVLPLSEAPPSSAVPVSVQGIPQAPVPGMTGPTEGATTNSAVEISQAIAPAPQARKPVGLIVGIVLVLAAAGGGGVFMLTRGSSETKPTDQASTSSPTATATAATTATATSTETAKVAQQTDAGDTASESADAATTATAATSTAKSTAPPSKTTKRPTPVAAKSTGKTATKPPKTTPTATKTKSKGTKVPSMW